jgi:hypothetical protein
VDLRPIERPTHSAPTSHLGGLLFITLSNVPAGGYGGALAYWILHSCEVIPTATDETSSFDVWWSIFQGMHAAVGYRTEMYITDGVTSPFGLFVGLGAAVVSAWFQSIASNSNYGANDATYFDRNRNMDEPYGRASAIAVSRAASGHVAAAPPSSAMNSRRGIIRSPRRFGLAMSARSSGRALSPFSY